MRYTLHKLDNKWWICLDGDLEYSEGEYKSKLYPQHELLIDLPYFEGEGSYVMDNDLMIIPEGSKLRTVVKPKPSKRIKVKFKEEILEKIIEKHKEQIDEDYIEEDPVQ